LADLAARTYRPSGANANGAFDAADAELRRLIREGFKQGISGEQLAEASGLSVPRVYQIRDGIRKTCPPARTRVAGPARFG
jgi:hypothetical protein